MKKTQLIAIFFISAIAIYGVSTIVADDNTTTDQIMPMDGSGQNGHQRGAMDGSQTQIKLQLKDGSGLGGMYGNQTGDCINP
jgi:hypothetical protein